MAEADMLGGRRWGLSPKTTRPSKTTPKTTHPSKTTPKTAHPPKTTHPSRTGTLDVAVECYLCCSYSSALVAATPS